MPDDTKPDAEAALRRLSAVPCVRADGTIRWGSRTGRPKKIHLAPDADARAYADEVAEIAQRFVDEDPVVLAASAECDRGDTRVLDETLVQLAREAAALRH